jgi:hypothetical protein
MGFADAAIDPSTRDRCGIDYHKRLLETTLNV